MWIGRPSELLIGRVLLRFRLGPLPLPSGEKLVGRLGCQSGLTKPGVESAKRIEVWCVARIELPCPLKSFPGGLDPAGPLQ